MNCEKTKAKTQHKMPMLKNPWDKYEPFVGPDVPDRKWPSRRITKAPRWLATDLRDGNQSLASPMTITQKLAFFKLLVSIGFKEIEVSTPTASDTEFNFTRHLIETPGLVPDDVWLQVLCPSRLDLIRRTVESLKGANKAIISLYFASSPAMLDIVFGGITEREVLDRVTEAVSYCRSITRDAEPSTRWTLMFSPEAFSASDTAFCARMCEAARAAWGPTTGPNDNPIIFTLPATVEVSTPNVYADQVELFASCLSDRGEGVCVSLHVHNDRGCAVAAAELGQMAGGSRVEGCLFGNGERAGNVDLVTLALNLYSQGVDPKLDFSDLAAVRALVEDINAIKVHPRCPYAGELFFTAYSGAHQDAISKGLARFKKGGQLSDQIDGGPQKNQKQLWKVPYLAMDPEDLGTSHDSIIRLTSQSGKGGVAWTLAQELNLNRVPRGLQLEFSQQVKRASEKAGGIVSPSEVADLFLRRYFISIPDPRFRSAGIKMVGGKEIMNGLSGDNQNRDTKGNGSVPRVSEVVMTVSCVVEIRGEVHTLRGCGPTVLAALANALAEISHGHLEFTASECDVESKPGAPETMVFVECQRSGSNQIEASWGVRTATHHGHGRNGGHHNAQLLAALSAALDLMERGEGTDVAEC